MSLIRQKICVVTGSRAEYGLLRLIISEIKNSSSFELQLLITGAHLSTKFGYTVSEIEADGHRDYKIAPIVSENDDSVSMAKSIGVGIQSITDRLAEFQPDLVLVLGDRYEILAASIAAYTIRIPIGHIHGGEVTGGALDEGYRHAITKMASLHFVAAEPYRRRVIQMGEHPSSVHTIGAPGLEAIKNTNFLDEGQLSEKLGASIKTGRYIVLAYHPETAELGQGVDAFREILAATDQFTTNFKILISKSNADAGGRAIGNLIDEYTKSRSASVTSFTSLGHVGFISLVKNSAMILGNSSSGIIEAPALGVPTINVGSRQAGRLFASSIIQCPGTKADIQRAIEKSLCHDAKRFSNLPYGTGSNVADSVVRILSVQGIPKTPIKPFYDLEGANP